MQSSIATQQAQSCNPRPGHDQPHMISNTPFPPGNPHSIFASVSGSPRNRHGLTTPANYPSAAQPHKAKRPTWQPSERIITPSPAHNYHYIVNAPSADSAHHASTILQTIPATIINIYNYHYSYYVTTL